MRKRGFAILGVVVVIALAMALGFGAVIVLEQSNLVSTAKNTQQEMTLRSHERVFITAVGRNPENTEFAVRNSGSVTSLIEEVLVVEEDNSLVAYDVESVAVSVLDNAVFSIPEHVGKNARTGVLTHLGNTFWEV